MRMGPVVVMNGGMSRMDGRLIVLGTLIAVLSLISAGEAQFTKLLTSRLSAVDTVWTLRADTE